MKGASFRLAPMSNDMRIGTGFLLGLPVLYGVLAVTLSPWFWGLVAALALGYAATWAFGRPARFVITGEAVRVEWPLRTAEISRAGLRSARVVDVRRFREEAGRMTRVGAGGLWGGFGTLVTEKRGEYRLYVSNTRQWVVLEHADEPWILSPDRPDEFVRSLALHEK